MTNAPEKTMNTDSFQGINPATGQSLPGHFNEATTEEVAQACEKAAVAFLEYRKKSGSEKADFLEKIADEIEAIGDELLQRAQAESGLPLPRLTGERGRTTGQLRLFAAYLREGSWVNARIDTALPDRQPLPRPDLRQMLRPLGPVGVFGASNFPLAFSVAGGDTASALAAGCPIVVKGHPAHPGTSQLVGDAIHAGRYGLWHARRYVCHGAGTHHGGRYGHCGASGHQSRWVYGFVAGGESPVRCSRPSPGTHSGLCRDGEYQPGFLFTPDS